jgi:hypothetical protein
MAGGSLCGLGAVAGASGGDADCRHCSCEFIEFLKLVDAAYAADTAIEIILDNHSAMSRAKPRRGSPRSLQAALPSPSDIGEVIHEVNEAAGSIDDTP